MKEYKISEEEIKVFVDDLLLGLSRKKVNNNCLIRYASRGIIFNNENKIALLNKKNKNEFKLPGGGVEEKETPSKAFVREVLEETGCLIDIIDYLGIAVEEKGLTNFKQISYLFIGKVKEDTHLLHLTKKEIDEGANVIWCDLENADKLVSNCINDLIGSKYDDLYKSLFMVKRDSLILKYYKEKYIFNNKKY